MRIYTMPFVFAGVLAFSAQVASAEVTVDSVAFAEEVEDREPINALSPSATCEGGQAAGSKVPVFDSASGDTIYFWSKVQAGSSGVLRHTWYMNKDNAWTKTADIELNFVESHSFRTWSSKTIVPSLHIGNWKVEVSTGDDPDTVLCSAKFRVM